MNKITIEHLARVEGNGGVTVTIDGNIVTDVKFNIFEGPRLIERLTVGRTPEEDVSLSPRICAICSVSHRNAALRAMENALSVTVPRKVYLTRELMHMGEMVESHSLHVYYLALPDYVGFPNAIAMASKFSFEVKIALEMKEFGNHIMKLLSGRYIHGENPVIGGFGKYPDKEELLWIKSRAIQFLPFVHKTVDLFCGLDYPEYPEEETLYVCCEPGDGAYGFWGDEILLSSGEKIVHDDYPKLTNEFVVPHSYAKRSRYKGKPYSVGALARVNNLGERLEGEAGERYKKYFNARWEKNPLFHNAAQALEILYCFERIPVLVDEMLKHLEDPPIVKYDKKEGQGTGLVEAPRGLLIHHYRIKDGLVEHADIITPTAQNAEDIERYCRIAAQKLCDEGKKDEIEERMNLVVRAFDPCISCSAHLAEVEYAPEEGWKEMYDKIRSEGNPVFVGVGNPARSDDALGVELAKRMRENGIGPVWLESEFEQQDLSVQDRGKHFLIFLDAVDFHEKPGKVTLFPLEFVFQNLTLSHRFMPFIQAIQADGQIKNAYVLGIQPECVGEGKDISLAVREAIDSVLGHLKN
jgi:sulfhydrogenase subunit alpha